MRIEKDPFTIKWYLDDRKIKKLPESQYRKAGLKIVIYDRLRNTRKHISTSNFFTRSEWEDINSVNVSNPPKGATREQIKQKANLDAIINNWQESNNIKSATTIKQLIAKVNGRNSQTDAGPGYLFPIFDLHIETKAKFSTRQYYEGARKKFYEYTISVLKGKDASMFLIDDLDKNYVHNFRMWYQTQTINNSRNAANSYLRALKAVLNWAAKPKQKYIRKRQNVFHYEDIVIPEADRRAEKYTLSEGDLKTLVYTQPTTDEMLFAKDMFIFQFLFGGVRIGDVFRLERKDIEEKDGVKWINFTAQKTIEHQKSNKVKILPGMQRIMDSYPGDDKYIFPILTEGMDEDQVYKKIKSKTSTCTKNLKKLCLIAGLDAHLSTSVSRYSVNHYLTVNNIATRNQVAEIMVNSPKVNLGYFDSKEKKFEIQEKLGDVLNYTKPSKAFANYKTLIEEFDLAKNEEQKKRFDKYLDLPFSIPSSTGFSVNRELAKNDGVEKLVQEDVDYLFKRINDIGDLISDMGMRKQEELEDKAKNKKDAHL